MFLRLISFSPQHSDCSLHFVLLRITSDEPSVNVSHPTAKKKVYAHQGTWKSFLNLFYKVRVFLLMQCAVL